MKLKSLWIPVLVLGCIAIGFFLGNRLDLFKTTKEEHATVMLEKVKKVLKLVAVEGYFSELYDYQENNLFDAPGLFNKKALIKVKAKASIGYDFEKLKLDIDETNKTITINSFPEPELLSLEHDLDYYDMQESLFNTFSADDLTLLNQKAKEFITIEALASPLLQSANEQKMDLVEMLKLTIQGSGWQVIVLNKQTPILAN